MSFESIEDFDKNVAERVKGLGFDATPKRVEVRNSPKDLQKHLKKADKGAWVNSFDAMQLLQHKYRYVVGFLSIGTDIHEHCWLKNVESGDYHDLTLEKNKPTDSWPRFYYALAELRMGECLMIMDIKGGSAVPPGLVEVKAGFVNGKLITTKWL